MFAAAVGGGQGNLLEVEPTADEDEKAAIAKMVDEIEERLGKLNKIAHERGEVLKDLKEKVLHSPMVTPELNNDPYMIRSKMTTSPISCSSIDAILVPNPPYLLQS